MMEFSSISLVLPDATIASGRLLTSDAPDTRTLLVAIHGGSYSSSYFSLRPPPKGLPFNVLAIDRPGRGQSTKPPPPSSTSSSIRLQGEWLQALVLPAIWKRYSTELGIGKLALYGHPVGGMVAVIAASLYCTSPTSSYPLSALILAGIGVAPLYSPMETIPFSLPTSDTVMVTESWRLDGMLNGAASKTEYDMEFLSAHERGNTIQLLDEALDVQTTWREYWRDYAKAVKGIKSVAYIVAGEDKFWDFSEKSVELFKVAFENTSDGEWTYVKVEGAPHCIELSAQRSSLWQSVGDIIERL